VDPDRWERRDRRVRGSALMLVPAALLIVLVLGALAIDAAVSFGAQRDLAAALSAAANDAVTIGLDEEHLRTTGEYRLDPDRVEAAVTASLRRRGALDGLLEPVRWRIDGPTVTVEAVGWAAHVVTPVIPGAPRGRVIPASARAAVVLRGG